MTVSDLCSSTTPPTDAQLDAALLTCVMEIHLSLQVKVRGYTDAILAGVKTRVPTIVDEAVAALTTKHPGAASSKVTAIEMAFNFGIRDLTAAVPKLIGAGVNQRVMGRLLEIETSYLNEEKKAEIRTAIRAAKNTHPTADAVKPLVLKSVQSIDRVIVSMIPEMTDIAAGDLKNVVFQKMEVMLSTTLADI
jgi:hypothetical protein